MNIAVASTRKLQQGDTIKGGKGKSQRAQQTKRQNEFMQCLPQLTYQLGHLRLASNVTVHSSSPNYAKYPFAYRFPDETLQSKLLALCSRTPSIIFQRYIHHLQVVDARIQTDISTKPSFLATLCSDIRGGTVLSYSLLA